MCMSEKNPHTRNLPAVSNRNQEVATCTKTKPKTLQVKRAQKQGNAPDFRQKQPKAGAFQVLEGKTAVETGCQRAEGYANMESKLKRCREKGPAEEHLTDRELKQKIQSVDRRRAKFYELYTGSPWRNMENFDVCVNTTHVSVRAWVPFLASLVESEK